MGAMGVTGVVDRPADARQRGQPLFIVATAFLVIASMAFAFIMIQDARIARRPRSCARGADDPSRRSNAAPLATRTLVNGAAEAEH